MRDDRLACGPTADAPVLVPAVPADLDRLVALQRAAYARNRELLGREPLPLLADYAEIMATCEVWVMRVADTLSAALIVEDREQDLLIWSVATHPGRQGGGLGAALLAAAEVRARQLGRSILRLYTGATLQHLIYWYARHGFAIECIEQLDDREITHMVKHLP